MPPTARTALRASDGKAETLFLTGRCQGRAARARPARQRSTTRIAKLPIPKVMSYQRADGYCNDVKFVRPAHRLVALHGADVVPVTALGLAAGRADRRPPLPRPQRHRDRHRRRLRRDARRRRQGHRRASPSAARRSSPASQRAAERRRRRSCPTRCSTRSPRWSSGRPSTPARFDPAFLDVPQECLILTMQQNQKYFALADARRQAASTASCWSATSRPHDPPAIVARQRARAARAARRRQVLLRPGPQGAARTRAADSSPRRLSQQARHASASASTALRVLAGGIAGMLGADAAHADARGAARQGRSRHRHGRRVPGTAGTDGPLLRRARRRGARRRRRDRAALLAALRRRRAARGPGRAGAWRSPTSSRRWPACSASAACRPATRIRSACAAPRSACCAS